MINFRNDYSEGALPQVLQALTDTNFEATCGYGMDDYCTRAAETVRRRFACPNADVHLMVAPLQISPPSPRFFVHGRL